MPVRDRDRSPKKNGPGVRAGAVSGARTPPGRCAHHGPCMPGGFLPWMMLVKCLEKLAPRAGFEPATGLRRTR